MSDPPVEFQVKHEGGGSVTIPYHQTHKERGNYWQTQLGKANFVVAGAGFGGRVRELEDGRLLIAWKLRTHHTPGAIEAGKERLEKVLGQAVDMVEHEPQDGWRVIDITWRDQ